MRKCWIPILLGLTISVAGCTTLGGSSSHADFEKVQKRREEVLTRPARPLITAEQVTADTAHQVSQDLVEEMDRESNRALQEASSRASRSSR